MKGVKQMLQENNEYVEVYKLDENGNRIKTKDTAKRGKTVGNGLYVIGVNNWIVNSKGNFLVQKRSMLKRNNPGKWSSTNGLRSIGEESIETCIRETKEELGIDISKCNINFVGSKIAGESLIVDIFLTKLDIDIEDITIQKEEVDEIRWVSSEELLKLDISTTCQYIKQNINEFLKFIDNNIEG